MRVVYLAPLLLPRSLSPSKFEARFILRHGMPCIWPRITLTLDNVSTDAENFLDIPWIYAVKYNEKSRSRSSIVRYSQSREECIADSVI